MSDLLFTSVWIFLFLVLNYPSSERYKTSRATCMGPCACGIEICQTTVCGPKHVENHMSFGQGRAE